ncbi:MerR family transcriptional regulator [Altibacter sp.]|uniref:MerR family transcriptional regulator n=1 Tax=Altibacter sp. TaxID=2024823 RepID=UPI000C8B2FBF|nr:MerR family transcriptional regulator [Altibacter sp.]MAP55408.1 MerR family transcriptional regulator [Altibacter sp.]
MTVKTEFSIKDLENLSSVKAHTIRIWEKRYNLLDPDRTDTNIRTYHLENLKKLLNVTFLYDKGYKISKIAKLSEQELLALVQKEAALDQEEFAIKALKTSMFDFDYGLFNRTYDQLLETHDFRSLFFEVFVPLLTDIGMLWQTGTIDPAHERFISELIKQKVIINIERAQQNFEQKHDPIFALYLPYEEIHEIGLLYVNYELISSGFKSIYLGANIPLDSLFHVLKHHPTIIFISYFTVQPERSTLPEYFQEFQSSVCASANCSLWIMGSQTHALDSKQLPKSVTKIANVEQLRSRLETLKKS